MKKSDIILPIFDIIDFEGSFTEEILDYLRDYRSIILVNKIDLMPDFIHPSFFIAQEIFFLSFKNELLSSPFLTTIT